MSRIHVVNSIEVPEGMERTAEEVRDEYVSYFRRQPGFVSSTFYKATDGESSFHYINVIVWANREAFEAVVNLGFNELHGVNADGRRVLGRGFPHPIVVHPGRYVVVAEDVAPAPGCKETPRIARGDLYWVTQGRDGAEQAIAHPHLVVQDDVFNQSRIDTVIVCGLTSNLNRANEPGNVLLNPGEGELERQSVVVVSQVASIKRSDLGSYIGRLNASRVEEVLSGLRFQQRSFFGVDR